MAGLRATGAESKAKAHNPHSQTTRLGPGQKGRLVRLGLGLGGRGNARDRELWADQSLGTLHEIHHVGLALA
eukprot:1940655-Alexandrium_andersonii.AAC.1